MEPKIFNKIKIPDSVESVKDVFSLDFTEAFNDLLFEDPYAYIYRGSLTTPSCDETV